MNKELETKDLQANFIKCFKELLTKTDKNIIVVNISREMAQDMVNLYEKYLTINSSEALKYLEELEQNIKDRIILAEDRQLKLCATIKQALLKSQELEKVIRIIMEKYVDIRALKYAKTYKEYNARVLNLIAKIDDFLTEEEFDLLKRYCNDSR